MGSSRGIKKERSRVLTLCTMPNGGEKKSKLEKKNYELKFLLSLWRALVNRKVDLVQDLFHDRKVQPFRFKIRY